MTAKCCQVLFAIIFTFFSTGPEMGSRQYAASLRYNSSKMPAGRPEIPYDSELADLICERIATSEDGLEDILAEIAVTRGKRTVGLTTIYKWMNEVQDFAEKSVRAREMQSHLLFDRAQKEARSPMIGVIRKIEQGKDKEGNPRDVVTETTSDNVERSKLLVQTTLRRAGQLNPKKYGERVQNEHTGENGGPIAFEVRTKSILEEPEKK